jgi:hypothetical protein
VTKVVGAVSFCKINSRSRRKSAATVALEQFKPRGSQHVDVATQVIWDAINRAMKLLPVEAYRLETIVVKSDSFGAHMYTELPGGHRLHVGLRISCQMLDVECNPGTWVIEGGCYKPETQEGLFVFQENKGWIADPVAATGELAQILVRSLFRAGATVVR